MKNQTIIQIVIIIVLTIVLGILVKFTIDAINENNMPQMAKQGMEQPNGDMPGQMGGNSSSVAYSGVKEITEDTTIESGEYSSTTSNGNATSKIKLTGDSYITSLEDDDTTYSNIDFNGYKLYVNGVAIN